MTWLDVNTTQSPNWTGVAIPYPDEFEFASFATLAFAEGCFADGSTGSTWELIVTPTTTWNPIST